MNKYIVKAEGAMENVFLNWLKDTIYKNKILTICRPCKTKSRNSTGTLSNKIIDETIIQERKKCCRQFLIFDVDDVDFKKIEKYKIEIKKSNNIILIINNPCFELILLSFFRYCEQSYLDKKWIEEKLNIELKHNKQEKYNHDLTSLKKILLFLENSPKHIEQFEKNILKYNDNNSNPSTNIVELTNLLKAE